MGAARTIGVITGLVALLLLLLMGQPHSREPTLGADLEITVSEAGGVQLSRQDPLPILRDPDLQKGEVARGKLGAKNISASSLRVGFAMTPEGESIGTVAAGQVWVRISQDGKELARTSVPGLTRGTHSLLLLPGEEKIFEFEAWIAGGSPGLYAGQGVDGRMTVLVSSLDGDGK